ncbi:MAG: hypothetical protein LBI73_11200 [Myroides sp.]|jgi:uncharacterized membrane protein|uniref:Uncharacterized protein n=1 Tax=Myroides marinus TaxID=703342 RepID=A0A163ZL14_9FLAO|nr:hypothetical protein [Myroides marinus]MDR0195679.1 hypothetical protein [Myroides sp.]KUF42184.1 hypothetical protein AS361_16075 [Myroides marinus]KZE81978.1 hypothetical protein AV926_07555 [Myroides marinus]MDM1351919.1 hypothetical protein [Myroides marinus]MDM1353561.1 hypothetical protein [Myroides marinus]
MFTPGQMQFALFFIIAFTIVMVVMYRKDLKLHRIYYKNRIWVLVVFLAFIGSLFVLKNLLK